MVKSDCKSLLQVEGLKMFCEYQRNPGDHCHRSTEFLDQLSSAQGCPTELMNGGEGWMVYCVWNVMAQAQTPDFVFQQNGWVHLNRRERQFSRLLAAEVCASVVVMLDTPCFEVVWRVLATHSIRQFHLPFPSRASPCAITFQLDSTEDQKNCQGQMSLSGTSWRAKALVTACRESYAYLPLTEDSRRAGTDKNWYKFSGTNVKSTQVNTVHTIRTEKRWEYGSLHIGLS